MVTVNEETYLTVLNTLASAAGMLHMVAEEIDLAEMRSICERFQALGPVLEPTAYHRGGGQSLTDQAAFLCAVDEFVTALRNLDRRPPA